MELSDILIGAVIGMVIEAVPVFRPVTRISTWVVKKTRSYVKAVKEFF